MGFQEGITGGFPTSIGNMTALESISFLYGGPDFGGDIPSGLFALPNLAHIALNFNSGAFNFPSSIPEGPRNIQTIMAKSGNIDGELPSYLSEFSLVELDLEKSNLRGNLPASFSQSLEYLNLHGNNLTGPLPEQLGELTNLEALALGKNKIDGQIPSTLGNLHKLQLLDLSFNKLEGNVPSTFSNLVALKHISLQHNKLEGLIAPFEPLRNLSTLLLNGNSFSSTIPAQLFLNHSGFTIAQTWGDPEPKIKPLGIIADFSDNKFTGSIPIAFDGHGANITYLATMKNELDADSIDEDICNATKNLYVNCLDCPCCRGTCCDMTVEDTDPICAIELDFYETVGLHCGPWWVGCQPLVGWDVPDLLIDSN